MIIFFNSICLYAKITSFRDDIRWDRFQSLWMYDKKAVCEKFLERHITLVRLDTKFIFYTQTISDLERHKPYFDIKSIRINLRPLITTIIDHAIEWRNTLGINLAEKTREAMLELNHHIQVYIFLVLVSLFQSSNLCTLIFIWNENGGNIGNCDGSMKSRRMRIE